MRGTSFLRVGVVAVVGCLIGITSWSVVFRPGALADDASPDGPSEEDPCECDAVVAKAKERIANLEAMATALAVKPAGLIVKDADGSLIGRVITVSAYAGFTQFRVVPPTIDTPFAVSLDGTLSHFKVWFETSDCTGQAYAKGGEGITAKPGTETIWAYDKGAPPTEGLVLKSQWNPYETKCGSFTYTAKTTDTFYPMVLVPKPFPIPVKLPLSVE